MELSRIYRGCPPKGKPSLSKDWYVEFGADRRQIKKGINKHKTIEGREKAAQALKDIMDKILIEEYAKGPKKDSMDISEAYEWAFEKNKSDWSEAHLNVHKSRKKYFLMAIQALGYKMGIREFSRTNMREVLEWIRVKRNLSRYSYIAYKEKYSYIFNVLKGWEHIDFNPCDFKPGFRKPPAKAKIILDDHERALVRKHLTEKHPDYFNYLMVLFHTSIRPSEIFRLKIRDINLDKGFIMIDSGRTKDKEDRMVFIPDVLLPYLKSMKLDQYPDHFNLFGPRFVPVERKKPVRGQTSTDKWKKLVKWPVEKGGLGINKNQYWLKDGGMRGKRIVDVPEDALMDQAGHSSWGQSKIYVGKYLPADIEKLKKNTKDF